MAGIIRGIRKYSAVDNETNEDTNEDEFVFELSNDFVEATYESYAEGTLILTKSQAIEFKSVLNKYLGEGE